MTLGGNVVTEHSGNAMAEPRVLPTGARPSRGIRAASSIALAAAVLAGAMALWAVLTAVTGNIEAGVVLDERSRTVVAVDATSLAAASGVRPGDLVLQFRRADEPGGWALETTGTGGQLVGIQAAEALLRASILTSLMALALAGFGVATSGSRPELASGAAAASVACAALTALASYQPVPTFTISSMALFGPWVWMITWRHARREWIPAIPGAIATFAGLSLIAWATPFLQLDWMRLLAAGAIASSTTGMLIAGGRLNKHERARLRESVGLLDVLVILGSAASAVAIAMLGIHILLAASVLVLPLVLLAGTRQRVIRLLDRLLLAEVREREGIRAMEAERARVAREIHDHPLQQIVAVIHTLEMDGNTALARDALRDAAGSLRVVATQLYPPALADLGLGAAIAGAARSQSDERVACELDDQAGCEQGVRLPEEVELAAYRIVQEALANAVQHAQAGRIAIKGFITAAHLRLSIEDDGHGIEPSSLAEALATGHMGMVSMRRRAIAIGATLRVERAAGGGTLVELEWLA